MTLLPEGLEVRLALADRSVRVGPIVGAGTEGEVFSIVVDGERRALKWYRPRSATGSRERELRDLIDRPSPHERFLWPQDLATSSGAPGFGYVMPFLPDGFIGSASAVSGRIEPGLSQLAHIGFELADSFLHLHGQGLCYRDISFGNVHVDPANGAVRVGDTDNVGIDGSTPSVLGTPDFMAPEVLRGEALPSRRTDLHSLAVLLFYLLTGGHPFDGRLGERYPVFDFDARVDLFGQRPVFVFDPANRSNALHPEQQVAMLEMWAIYPAFITDRFVEAFTVGAAHADERVTESIWRKAMVRLEANVTRCPTCTCENFADGPGVCWNCGTPIPKPARLVLADLEIMLTPDRVVRSYEIDQDYQRDEPFADVTENPRRPEQRGLRNRTTEVWHANHPRVGPHEVAPGRSIALDDGLTLRVGKRTTARVVL